jgi:dihydrofolate synthase/folylpolyglutamate synthase
MSRSPRPGRAVVDLDRDGIVVELVGGPARVGLRGRHQAANVAVADALLDALGDAGIARVGPEDRRRGYAAARWPGRLELLSIGTGDAARDVLLDGAHNPAGATVLARALDDLRPFLTGGAPPEGAPQGPPPVTVVMAMMSDKDVDGVVGALTGAEALVGARIICTDLGLPRSLAGDDVARRWASAPGIRVAVDDGGRGLDRALRRHLADVVVAHSPGEIRPAVDEPELRPGRSESAMTDEAD